MDLEKKKKEEVNDVTMVKRKCWKLNHIRNRANQAYTTSFRYICRSENRRRYRSFPPRERKKVKVKPCQAGSEQTCSTGWRAVDYKFSCSQTRKRSTSANVYNNNILDPSWVSVVVHLAVIHTCDLRLSLGRSPFNIINKFINWNSKKLNIKIHDGGYLWWRWDCT